jgi:hypothetical protein
MLKKFLLSFFLCIIFIACNNNSNLQKQIDKLKLENTEIKNKLSNIETQLQSNLISQKQKIENTKLRLKLRHIEEFLLNFEEEYITGNRANTLAKLYFLPVFEKYGYNIHSQLEPDSEVVTKKITPYFYGDYSYIIYNYMKEVKQEKEF